MPVVVGDTKRLFLKGEVKIFVDVGKSVLKFKEIMWKSVMYSSEERLMYIYFFVSLQCLISFILI